MVYVLQQIFFVLFVCFFNKTSGLELDIWSTSSNKVI